MLIFLHQVRIFQDVLCSCVTQSFDESSNYLFLSYLLNRVPYNSAVEPEPVTHELAIVDNIIVRFTTLANPPRRDRYYFTVKLKTNFSTVQHPAQILSFPTLVLSPLSLAQSSSASCALSVDGLLDYGNREVFTYRVIHSAQLLLSSVEVINNAGRVLSTAHLIRGDILPTRFQVNKPEKCCTMDEMAGERAILIRGSQDWGICVGKWEGFVKGVPGVPGVKGTSGNPGVRGIPGIKGQPGFLSIKFFSLFGAREWKRVEKRGDIFSICLLGKKITVDVDLRTGMISFPPEVHDVPEAIALGFSIAILHLLCQPYPSTTKTNYLKPSKAASDQRGKPRRIRNENLMLVVAAGYYADNVPTNSYIKYETGGGGSSGCGGCGGCGGGFKFPKDVSFGGGASFSGSVSFGGDGSIGGDDSGGCGGCGGCGCGGCGD